MYPKARVNIALVRGDFQSKIGGKSGRKMEELSIFLYLSFCEIINMK